MQNEFIQFNHIFGPVPSRRLGMSLGIDMIPFKTCTLNCIYCECGKTSHHTVDRTEYISAKVIIDELDHFLKGKPPLDVITYGGSGEPTLNTALKQVIDHIKSTYPDYKTAILTNGTLLYLEEVRQCIMPIDYVLPSLDAVSQPIFEKINNPVSELTSSMVVEGLTAFAKEYTGTLWVEVFIVPGLNDTENELALLKEVFEKIKPTRVQLNTLDRPPAYSWVKPTSPERLTQIADYLLPLPVEIITRQIPVIDENSTSRQNTDNLCAVLKRRPMTIEDIAVSLNKNINEIFTLLDNLKNKHILTTENVSDKTFYRIL